jgi:abortive infection bacteriophage resistance protein
MLLYTLDVLGGRKMSKIKNTNSLMKYLRDTHHITVGGSIHKRKLRNIGYYHGFKGYRFIKTPKNRINFSDFDQLLAVNSFDMELKTLFYPQAMFIETALKNYVLEITLNHSQTENFNTIYETLLTNYKNFNIGSSSYNKTLHKRLRLRDQFYNVLTRNFSNNKQVVQHFYHKDQSVPIWAIFEVISLGEFGNFISACNSNVKRDISKSLSLNQSCDSKGELTESIIYIIKDLRNSIAHNDVIFDTRFKSSTPSNSLLRALELDTGIKNISFNTIVDYLILFIYLLKNLRIPKMEMTKMVSRFEYLIDRFRTQIPFNIYSSIFYTDTRNKITVLKTFILK